MTNYRERIVRRAARTAARQTMLLKRVNDAFGETANTERRDITFTEAMEALDSITRRQSVYNQTNAAPIVQAIPQVVSGVYRNMNEGR
jgi:hypothetical protein|tara:strand:+ start:1206 stop:1469 length:264 start_codon:yes stop_codon:yes gene_type:complete